MEKFNENLKFFLQSILILSAKNFIIDLKISLQNPPKSGGRGRTLLKIFPPKSGGAAAPPPGSGPHDSYVIEVADSEYHFHLNLKPLVSEI